jgi:hypothetical protein
MNGFVTQDEATDVLERLLPLASGDGLAPLRGISVAPSAPVAGVPFGVGLGLVVVGIAAALASRRRFSPLVRAVPVVAAIAGVFVMARSLRAL